MKTSIYVAISLDGFIAKLDGNIDWLAEDVSFEDTVNDENYKTFFDSVDALVFGGKTYRQTRTFGDWPYPNKKCVVVSRTETASDLPNVSFTTDSPEQIAQRLQYEGFQHVWVMGGGEIHTMFLNAGLIDEVRIFILPKILGEGIPLFAPPLEGFGMTTRWKLLDQKRWRGNIVELHYAKSGDSPKQVLTRWIELFNWADAEALAELYHDDAVNHQVANEPFEGKINIQAMFEQEFAVAEMVCIPENLFEDGEWAILEWRDQLGLRGCGFFHIVDGKIKFQRGYWDKLSFLRQHGLPIPVE